MVMWRIATTLFKKQRICSRGNRGREVLVFTGKVVYKPIIPTSLSLSLPPSLPPTTKMEGRGRGGERRGGEGG